MMRILAPAIPLFVHWFKVFSGPRVSLIVISLDGRSAMVLSVYAQVWTVLRQPKEWSEAAEHISYASGSIKLSPRPPNPWVDGVIATISPAVPDSQHGSIPAPSRTSPFLNPSPSPLRTRSRMQPPESARGQSDASIRE